MKMVFSVFASGESFLSCAAQARCRQGYASGGARRGGGWGLGRGGRSLVMFDA